jgi:glycopeptide antibiotics resistance protein
MSNQIINEGTITRTKRLAAYAIIVGIILYLSKFLREYFVDNSSLLFILGFLPNLGLAFAIPFIYVSNRVRQGKPVRHFSISCIVTLLLMVLNEIRDKYQAVRVFDMLDIYASVTGVILAYLVYRWTFSLTST